MATASLNETPKTTAPVAAPEPSSSSSSILLKAVFSAYLNPLLKKHALHQVLTYEDLTSSWQAAFSMVAKSANGDQKSNVREKLTSLHQGQLREYREAAVPAILEWLDHTFELPSIGETDSLSLAAYQKKCAQACKTSLPAWNITQSQTTAILKKVHEQAATLFESNSTSKHETEEEEEDDGEIEEDEEEDGEEGEENTEEEEKPAVVKTKQAPAAGKAAVSMVNKKGGVLAKKKAVPTKAKAGAAKKAPAGRARRARGRGKGTGAAK